MISGFSFQKFAVFAVVCLLAFGSVNCFSRYKIKTGWLSNINPEKRNLYVIDAAKPETHVWQLSKVKMGDSSLTARFDRTSYLLADQLAHIRKNSQKRENRDNVLVYVYPETAKAYGDTLSTRLDFVNISKIEVFKPDAGKVVGLVFGIAGGIAVAGGIALVIACQCPHVYVDTPDGPQLEGEMFGGAAYPQLERHDWLPLPHLQAIDNQYKIHLANREHQNQHTNFLELEVLDVAPGIHPLFDKYGQLQTIAAPQAPASATDVLGKNVLAEVLHEDEKIYRGNPENDRPDATEYLNLTFAKPPGARQAKLVLNAKNNPWMDYIYFQFQDAMGKYADDIRKRYRAKSADANRAWLDRQKVQLDVWLETRPGHWGKVDFFNLAGSSTLKNSVLSLDLSQLRDDSVRLRLEFGFRFWEIDYAALDFSDNLPVQRHTLRPVSAVSQSGENVLPALIADDANYYDQPNLGDEATLVFEPPALASGQVRSFILHGRGHYEIHYAPATGKPNIFQLRAWDKENALPRFSREQWQASVVFSDN